MTNPLHSLAISRCVFVCWTNANVYNVLDPFSTMDNVGRVRDGVGETCRSWSGTVSKSN